MVEPRFTIVTPSYNQARYLERALRSVIEQDYPHVEHIVVDGGSIDGSVEIIERFAHHLAWWVSERDKGQADAIDRGFRRSTGDILAWINSSDEYAPGAFRRIASLWRPGRSLFFSGDSEIIDEEGRPEAVESSAHLDLHAFAFEGVIPCQPGTFWTREAYERSGGIDPTFQYCMDVDLFVRLARVARIVYVPEILGRLRKHEDAKTARPSDSWERERRRIERAAHPDGGFRRGRKALSLLKRLGRFASEGRWGEARNVLSRFRKAKAW